MAPPPPHLAARPLQHGGAAAPGVPVAAGPATHRLDDQAGVLAVLVAHPGHHRRDVLGPEGLLRTGDRQGLTSMSGGSSSAVSRLAAIGTITLEWMPAFAPSSARLWDSPTSPIFAAL